MTGSQSSLPALSTYSDKTNKRCSKESDAVRGQAKQRGQQCKRQDDREKHAVGKTCETNRPSTMLGVSQMMGSPHRGIIRKRAYATRRYGIGTIGFHTLSSLTGLHSILITPRERPHLQLAAPFIIDELVL